MLKKLGIELGKNFDISKIDPAIARGLQRAVKEAPIKLAEGAMKMKNVNGWIQPHDIGRYGTDYDTRAGIAMVGLGADQQEDTIYPIAFVDKEANWLPAPMSGEFNICIRNYGPKEAALDGTYKNPPIRRVP